MNVTPTDLTPLAVMPTRAARLGNWLVSREFLKRAGRSPPGMQDHTEFPHILFATGYAGVVGSGTLVVLPVKV